MFWVFFQDWFYISQPDSNMPFTDFLVSCSQSTREVYTAYSLWWIKKHNQQIQPT